MQKWRKRQTATDAAMGPKAVRSTVLTPEEEAVVAGKRQAHLKQPDDWITQDAPELRIVDGALWSVVKARQTVMRGGEILRSSLTAGTKLPPSDGGLEIDTQGDLAAIITIADAKKPCRFHGRASAGYDGCGDRI